jgi:hypothetical protein
MTLTEMPRAAARVVLITSEEAQLPAPTQFASSRAITRGPRIDVSAIDERKLHSPLRFRLKFRAFGGSSIDPKTVAVTYLRGTNIDLTRRIKTFIRSTGIDVPDAVVPPGEHAIEVYVKDTEGRVTTVSFLLKVVPN